MPLRFFLLITLLGALPRASATAQEAQDPERDAGAEGSSMFIGSFGFHDPLYFMLGPEPVFNAKFQLSFRFRLFDASFDSRPLDEVPGRGLFVGYTQLSFWDLDANSQPFFDTSYKPSLFFLYQAIGGRGLSWVYQFDLEFGFQHESNGKDGLDSRSIDILYIQPGFTWRVFGRSNLIFAPKAWIYVGKEFQNSDIEEFRGYFDLQLTWRFDRSLQLRTHTHIGSTGDAGSFQADLTFPMSRLWHPLNFYLMAQFFDGYAETILRYDENTEANWRFGIAFSR